MPHIDTPKRVPVPPAEPAAQEAAKRPGPADVHEQREIDQNAEAVVEKKKDGRPPTQSLIDEERGDWEGIGATLQTEEHCRRSCGVAVDCGGCA